jgi:RNA polymerase sigma-70 factor, ECF subfamily
MTMQANSPTECEKSRKRAAASKINTCQLHNFFPFADEYTRMAQGCCGMTMQISTGNVSPALHESWVGEPEASLELLMSRYQAGDRAAAGVLIRRVSPVLHRLFIAHALSRWAADDLLQETWLRVHHVRHTYRPGETVLPWFYAIARHVRIDHYRQFCRTQAREESFDEASILHTGVARRDDQDLESLLAPLPQAQREILEMLKVAGMSLEEVARATSSSVGSVKQKVHRAYERLRRTLGSLQSSQDDE